MFAINVYNEMTAEGISQFMFIHKQHATANPDLSVPVSFHSRILEDTTDNRMDLLEAMAHFPIKVAKRHHLGRVLTTEVARSDGHKMYIEIIWNRSEKHFILNWYAI